MRRLCPSLVPLMLALCAGGARAADLDEAFAPPPPPLRPVCSLSGCVPVPPTVVLLPPPVVAYAPVPYPSAFWGASVVVPGPIAIIPPPTVLDVEDDRNGYNQ